MRGSLKSWLSVSVLGLILALAGACGVKSSPYPAMATLPGKVQGLGQTQTEEGELILSWSAPQNNMLKRPLSDIGGFEIRMADNTISDSYCAGCPHRFETVDKVKALPPPPGLNLAPGPYAWRRQLNRGHVYVLRVYSVAPGGGIHPEAYAETTVWALEAPGDLPGFSAAMGDRWVDLKWRVPAGGYQAEIQRKSPDGAWAALGGLDQASGQYRDLSVQYEQTYIYRARLAKVKDQSSVPGPWSKEITIKTIDDVPPNPPGYLEASISPKGVELRWESLVFNPDFAGYRLYRQREGEADFTRIGPELLTDNIFFDPVGNWNGEKLRYRVTAVDKSVRANESQPSTLAEVYLDTPHDPAPRPE